MDKSSTDLVVASELVAALDPAPATPWLWTKLSFGALLAILACLFSPSTSNSVDAWNPIWAQPDLICQSRIVHIPLDFLQGVEPIRCHSHNDYERRIPLFEALQSGCTSVEADVWLQQDEALLVSHRSEELRLERDLEHMYIAPLLQILDRRNQALPNSLARRGVFPEKPSQSLVLLFDIKSHGAHTVPVVAKQLEPLRSRGYLTRVNGTSVIPGPITVVGSGNTPFDLVTAQPDRDIFFDAPLTLVEEEHQAGSDPAFHRAFNVTNSYYASASFRKALNKDWQGVLPPNREQLATMERQIAAAHQAGLKVRYWGTPEWVGPVRDQFWRLQEEVGVDVISVDHVQAFAQGAWRRDSDE